jgi:hypothetical protein
VARFDLLINLRRLTPAQASESIVAVHGARRTAP